MTTVAGPRRLRRERRGALVRTPVGVETPKVVSGAGLTEPGPNVTLRDYLSRYARAVEVKLRANDHKGGIDDMRVDCAIERLWKEVRELDLEAYRDRSNPIATWKCKPSTLAATANEALDVGAFAMAVWLACRRDHEERRKEISEEKARA